MSDKGKARKGGKPDPEQLERFEEAAHDLGCEDNRQRMDEVVRRAAKLPPPRKSAAKPREANKPKE